MTLGMMSSHCTPCCSPPSTTTCLIATSLVRVKGKVELIAAKKFTFMGHHHLLSKKHANCDMNCQFNGAKENGAAPLHVTGDLVLLPVNDIKTIDELPKLTKKSLAKERNEMVKKKMDKESIGVLDRQPTKGSTRSR
jgi:hypothetical protein